jgi:Flp pilus assembly pilin Flp
MGGGLRARPFAVPAWFLGMTGIGPFGAWLAARCPLDWRKGDGGTAEGGEATMLHFAEALYGLYAGEREGQGLVEYALLLGFVALVMFAALAFFKDQLLVAYSRIGTSLPTS